MTSSRPNGEASSSSSASSPASSVASGSASAGASSAAASAVGSSVVSASSSTAAASARFRVVAEFDRAVVFRHAWWSPSYRVVRDADQFVQLGGALAADRAGPDEPGIGRHGEVRWSSSVSPSGGK